MLETADPANGPWGPRQERAAPAHAALVSAIAARGIPSVVQPEFVGARGAVARMMLRGLLLYIPTFGFNRFWLRTEQRRFYWLNTRLAGASFEYRGTARELVIGFLYALAIYLPIAAAYSLAGLYAETVQSYASVPFAVFTYAFTYFASYRARRYRLTRTAFRGIRFWMRGSGVKLGLVAFLWLVLTGLTLGIAYFWMQAWLERYKMSHSSYGSLPGRFEGTGGSLLRAYGLPGLVIVICFGLLAGWFAFTLMSAFFTGSASDAFAALWLLLPVILFAFVPAAWSVLSVVKMRWWLNGVRFGDVAISNNIRSTAMIGSALKTALLAGGALAIWGIIAVIGVRTVAVLRGVQSQSQVFTDTWVVVAMLLSITVALLITMFLKATLYNYEFMQRFAATTTVTGLDRIETVSAAGTPEGIVGEGLADALGADGF